MNALRDWNARCRPQWPEAELRQKVRNAIKYGKGRRGEKLVEFPTTEAGDAEFFADRHADAARFDHRRDRWLLAGADGVWESDHVEALNLLAIELMRERQRRATLIPDSHRRGKFLKWAVDGESRRRITNALALAESMPPLADDGDGWDRDPWLLGVLNGVVDLRTGQLRPARPEERVTMRAGAPYDPDARSDEWDQALPQIFPHDGLVAFMQTLLGYSATGETKHDKWMLSTGGGRNGKGTVYGAVRAALGDYALELPASVFDTRKNQEYDLAKLPGKRFVTSSESGDTLHLNHDRIKQLSGGDPLRAADKYEKSFEFFPACKLWLACNKKPRVTDDTVAFWARVILVPFTASFLGKENADLRPALEKQPEHRRAVLAWIITGARRYYQQGGVGPLPKVVKEAVEDYRRQSEPLAPFYDACCEIGHGLKVQASVLYSAYCQWAGDRRPLNMKTFGLEVRKRFEAEEKRNTWYVGLGLREDRPVDMNEGQPS